MFRFSAASAVVFALGIEVLFGEVHVLVRLVDLFVDIAGGRGTPGKAHGRAEIVLRHGFFGLGHIGKEGLFLLFRVDDDELIPTYAVGILVEETAQVLGGTVDELVPRKVPLGVVDLFQAVQVKVGSVYTRFML